MTTVAVQMPAFKERAGVRPALTAWKEQNVPPRHKMALQVWVTPETPRFEDDPTVQAARTIPGVSVHEAPQGKLSARNAAHEHAVDRGYDAIVTADADVVPDNEGVFVAMANLLSQRDIAAVNSKVRTVGGIAGPVVTAAATIEDRVRPHMHGQLSGFTVEAWEHAGPFDDSLDQTSMKQVRAEEEFDFYRRLQEHGEVVTPSSVRAVEGTRRVECHVQRSFARFGAPQDEWCGERGVSTFHWRE